MSIVAKITAICLRTAFVTIALWAAVRDASGVALSDDLQGQLRDVRAAWKEHRINDVQHLTDHAITRLYSWFERELSGEDIKELIHAVEPFAETKVLEPKSHLKVQGGRIAQAPITLHVYLWRADGREVVVLQADGVSAYGDRHARADVDSKPPVVLAKEGHTVTSRGVYKLGFPGCEYSVLGFLAGPTGSSWPDVVVSCAPTPRAGYAYYGQLHLVEQPPMQWKSIWAYGDPTVAYIDFDPQTGRLLCLDGYKMVAAAWRLTYGEQAKEGR
jgi:hypothetical protein